MTGTPGEAEATGGSSPGAPGAARAGGASPGPARGHLGLVVMAYGTPRSPEEVAAYYTHIRRGRPPTPDQLADLVARYDAIGGLSPLAARTAEQVAGIAAALDRAEPGRWRAVPGNKHAAPFVEDAVDELAAAGAAAVVGLVLAPHYSRASVGEYHARAAGAAGRHGLRYLPVERWHDEEAWRDAQAARLRATLAGLPGGAHVLFTAHSLPERVLQDDPYVDELAASASAIASRAGLPAEASRPGEGDRAPGPTSPRRPGGAPGAPLDPAGPRPERGGHGSWSLAWQSAGRTPEPWRGPDILEVIAVLAEDDRVPAVAVCPQGFVSDHLEVLYDLDIDARREATARGLAFARTASINDDPAVLAALAVRVRRLAAGVVGEYTTEGQSEPAPAGPHGRRTAGPTESPADARTAGGGAAGGGAGRG